MSSERFLKVWSGAFLAPVPMVIALLVVAAAAVGFEVSAVVWVVLAYVLVWVPMVVSYALLRILAWRSLRAYTAVMFAVTLLPLLVIYPDSGPDVLVSASLSGGGSPLAGFAIGSGLVATSIAALNMACMALFWRFSVRSCAEQSIA